MVADFVRVFYICQRNLNELFPSSIQRYQCPMCGAV